MVFASAVIFASIFVEGAVVSDVWRESNNFALIAYYVSKIAYHCLYTLGGNQS